MPNTKSAIRRVRRVKKQTQVNRIRKSKYKNAVKQMELLIKNKENCLLYTSPSPRDLSTSRMPSSA